MMRTFFLTFSILLVGCGDKETDATTVVPDNSAKLQASLDKSLAEVQNLSDMNAKLANEYKALNEKYINATNRVQGLSERIEAIMAEGQRPPVNAANAEVAQLKAVIEKQKNFILQLRQAQGAKPKPAAAAAAGGASKPITRKSFELWMKNKSAAEVIRWKRPDTTQAPFTAGNYTSVTWSYENTTYDSLTKRIDYWANIIFENGRVRRFHYIPGINKVQ